MKESRFILLLHPDPHPVKIYGDPKDITEEEWEKYEIKQIIVKQGDLGDE